MGLDELKGQQSEKHEEEGAGSENHGHEEHLGSVSVNENPVDLVGHSATGFEIKVAAIEQGVLIEPNFVLQEELPNGTSRIVGDKDVVRLRKHLRFTAIAPDDNS